MKKAKQILAIIGVILFLAMVIVTLIMAFCDTTENMWIFKGCLAVTIFIPLVSYGYICLHRFAMTRSGRKNYYDSKE